MTVTEVSYVTNQGELYMTVAFSNGGNRVEIVTLSAKLDSAEAEQAAAASPDGAFVGIRVATMNSDGNLFLLQHPVARLLIDRQGRIQAAEPAIHRSLSGFVDVEGAPPVDLLQSNRKTPFVWADEHS